MVNHYKLLTMIRNGSIVAIARDGTTHTLLQNIDPKPQLLILLQQTKLMGDLLHILLMVALPKGGLYPALPTPSWTPRLVKVRL